jgi:DNA-binding MarR family transcriptional regulator
MTKTDGNLPLPTLLSYALVAFTIELDNEFEHRMPHRTSDLVPTGSTGPSAGPWLVSMAMWANCMRFLGDGGMRVRELEDLAVAKTNLEGMRRWGYVEFVRDPAESRAKPPSTDLIIRPTREGRVAQETWRPLAGEIERRWCARFSRGHIDRLRQSLVALAGQSRRPMPYCLPILGYGLWTGNRVPGRRVASTAQVARVTHAANNGHAAHATQSANPADLELPTLLSRALLGLAVAYERESPVSLAIGANVLRVLTEDGVRVRDLPHLTGVAKPGVDMSLGMLQKLDFADVGPNPDGSRWKIARLTPGGRSAQESHQCRLAGAELVTRSRFGTDAVNTLRGMLEPLVGDPTGQRSPLYAGLAPYPDGWRAKIREPDTLPHFPVILQRGGYPDGN